MNKYILAGAAALALAVPAAAQDMAMDANGDVYVMTAPQQTMYDGWPAERQTMYEGWPNTYKVYYWTLTPVQQNGWWVLTDDQRAKVYAMTPEQRAQAWTAIAAQMNGSATGATASSGAMASANTGAMAGGSAGAMSGNVRWVSNEMVQSVPAASNANLTNAAELPVCTPNQQDGCINSWEKNKTGTRPLNYWPGKPASEMPGKKPMATTDDTDDGM